MKIFKRLILYNNVLFDIKIFIKKGIFTTEAVGYNLTLDALQKYFLALDTTPTNTKSSYRTLCHVRR